MVEASVKSKNWAAPFFTIWTGQAFSLVGSQLAQFALVWWLTTKTGSATVLATASLVALLPQILLGPIAGTLIDRWNRRITMMVADGAVALASVGLIVLFTLDRVEIWHIYLIMLVRAAAGGCHWAAMFASTSLMVPNKHLSRIQGFNHLLNGGLNIVSAPLGALLLSILAIQNVLMIDVCTAVIAIFTLSFVRIPQPKPQQDERRMVKPSIWQDLKAGLRFTLSWPGVLIVIGMAMLINLFLITALRLLPILVTKHFHGEALELGWLESSLGVGVVLGSLLLSSWGGFKKRILTSLMGLVGLGAGSFLLGMTPADEFSMGLVAMFLMGFMLPLVNGSIEAIEQSIVPPEMLGRVSTLAGSAIASVVPIGLIVAGPVVDRFGVQVWFLAGGIVSTLLGLGGFFIPSLVNIEGSHRPETEMASAD